jgi:hypothetical protein
MSRTWKHWLCSKNLLKFDIHFEFQQALIGRNTRRVGNAYLSGLNLGFGEHCSPERYLDFFKNKTGLLSRHSGRMRTLEDVV